MLRIGAPLVSALLLVGAAVAGQIHWIPGKVDVAKLEAQAKPPEGYRLNRYDRAYSGTYISGRKIIEGRWVEVAHGQRPKVEIVAYDQLPNIADGGCSVVTVYYDVVTAKVASVHCNGLG